MWVKEVMTTLQCSYNSCRKWRDEGKLRTTKMPNGKVMYWDDDVYALMGKKIQKENWTVAYCRVNGTTESDQRLMLQQQQLVRNWSAQRGISLDKLYDDWCPATDFSLDWRPGLHDLIQDVIKKKISVIIVETPCRLARVGWELFPAWFRYYGVEVVVINSAITVPEYRLEQEKDLTNLLLKAGVDRLDKLGADTLPIPKKREKREHPGKITPNWEDKPETPTERDLSDLM
jgi:predicted site-specific integrase-resolvase